MKTKLLLLFLMFTLAVTSCSTDNPEPIKTCGTIINMSISADANNVKHYYIEIRRVDKGIPTNIYDSYEVVQSEFDKIFSTFLYNSNNDMTTDDCVVTLKLVATRTTNRS